jgi:hypothetical protein
MRQLSNLRKTGYRCSGLGEVPAVILRRDGCKRATAKEFRSLAAEGRTARAADCSPSQHASLPEQRSSPASHSDAGALAAKGRTAREAMSLCSPRRPPSKNDFGSSGWPRSLWRREDPTPKRSPRSAAADFRRSTSLRAETFYGA